MEEQVHDSQRLAELQALPLYRKVMITQTRIIEWYLKNKKQVYVAFSGGKDSTVLLHLVRQAFPDVEAVFSNTGLEYPEIQKFAQSFDNVRVVRPKMRFDAVVSKYGYPLLSKEISRTIWYARKTKATWAREMMLGNRKHEGEISRFNKNKYLPLLRLPFLAGDMCCSVMKKAPVKTYQKESGKVPFIGTQASEGGRRRQAWLKNGCNAFDSKDPKSTPMAFWKAQDVLQYIVDNNLPICSVYGDVVAVDEEGNEYATSGMISGMKLRCTGCDRTGCIFCAYGAHLTKGETKFQRLARTHPRQYEYCIGGGQWVDNPDYDSSAPKYDGDWENWNPKQIWVPSKKGLGMGKVFDMVNALYGKDFYRYE